MMVNRATVAVAANPSPIRPGNRLALADIDGMTSKGKPVLTPCLLRNINRARPKISRKQLIITIFLNEIDLNRTSGISRILMDIITSSTLI